MKKFNNFKAKAMIAVMLLLFLGCQDDVEKVVLVDDDSPTSENQHNEVMNGLASVVARNLANGLANSDVRRFVKSHVMDRFDGDFNFLIETSKDDALLMHANGRVTNANFGNIISGNMANAFTSARVSESNAFLDSLRTLYPLLQVAVPSLEGLDIEDWDVEANIPMVAFLPLGIDESDENAVVPAYDAEGNYYELSLHEEPEELVVVISRNERVAVLEKGTDPMAIINSGGGIHSSARTECVPSPQPFHSSDDHDYYLRSHFEQERRRCNPPPPPPPTYACDRDRPNNKMDFINKAKFASMTALTRYEKWASGQPELRVIVVYSKKNGSLTTYDKIEYGVSGTWWDRKNWFSKRRVRTVELDHSVIKWNRNVNGDSMKYIWIEEDKFLIPVNLNISVSVGGVLQIHVIAGAYTMISETPVHYCHNTDGEGSMYGGDLLFWINQQANPNI